MKTVRISVELSEPEAYELYMFTKRVRFDQALELTECWKSKDARNDQAYEMIGALSKVNDALLERR